MMESPARALALETRAVRDSAIEMLSWFRTFDDDRAGGAHSTSPCSVAFFDLNDISGTEGNAEVDTEGATHVSGEI
jgi:hypothetical protein